MIKQQMIRERLSLIQDAVDALRRLGDMSETEFSSDYRNPAAAESYLRKALEAVFDIGRHLLAAHGHLSLASEYKSIARGLGQQGFVDRELASRLELMAGYRNRLVHLYAQVTPPELWTISRDNLHDLRAYILAIDGWLGSQPAPQ